ncbi:MAG: RING finger protein [Myxococcota bacterium]
MSNQNPNGMGTQSVSARTGRSYKRDVSKCIRSLHYTRDDICPICYETLHGDRSLLATTCNHLMHMDCWDQYVNTSINRLVENDSDVSAQTVIATFIYRFAGPHCPVCRNEVPTLHWFALAVQDKDFMSATAAGLVGLNVDTALKFASMRKRE